MKIFIQGFKSIRDGQYVALGRKLTFLVGPNSAGKSVVKLALDRLSGDSSDFDMEEKLIFKNPNQSDQMAGFHSLGLEWENKKEVLSCITSYCFSSVLVNIKESSLQNLESFDSIFKKNSLISRDRLGDSDWVGERIRKITSFHINKIPYLLVDRPVWTGYDFSTFLFLRKLKNVIDKSDNYIFKISNAPNFAENRFHEISSWSSSLEGFDKIFKNEGVPFVNIGSDFFQWNGLFVRELIKPTSSHGEIIGKERQARLNVFERYDAIVNRKKNFIVKRFGDTYPGKSLTPVLISADRVIPTMSDIKCKIKAPLSFNPLDSSISNSYHDLMGSAVALEWGDPFREDVSLRQRNCLRKDLYLSVNKALSENLFVDNGYQLQVESKILISKDNWNLRLNDAVDFEEESPVFDCSISLRDAHGRDLSFDEVGSGIGYVMPVLIESFRFSNANKVVFLQQPELHLHPALQANLTDVLIEASANKRIVAETHSEHMILRALKRVRQTTNKTLKDPNLALSPDDISVNYFEPMPDGSTKVHILRVSEDGDFLDRWPNGFFAERDQELFDE